MISTPGQRVGLAVEPSGRPVLERKDHLGADGAREAAPMHGGMPAQAERTTLSSARNPSDIRVRRPPA